ncbi:DUF3748 domain-containing protein [Sphingobacterium sp. UT-1RO-CII-1]|uniref:DUF3748 domain-containing protein n=1 Tax=Sphingobacterium sp. UT-1RO-CII-1 TaxID=2995225 RepID=UPI00227B79BA|nr:DUF3748 domain-containing protein [Sphingobacterium sp. UT-1RO-CII-1]MCY4779324.1 DUF3748 domain-containing protein [Sphingobacterium sp. UT-1RO-CII-1]
MNRDENLTRSLEGHTLHHNNVFSKSGEWIVFDGRNDDTKIGETAVIGIVNAYTGEERLLYKVPNQTVYGPGVGAASFHPKEDKVIFIHGLPDADEHMPYAISRRTAKIVDLADLGTALDADARDIEYPYLPGSLRGGTHSHCWSPDGTMVSFTYNDEYVDRDIRMVGVMVKADSMLQVDKMGGNNDGAYYSAIVSDVKRNPLKGSDEISKAFDECWLPATAVNGLKHDAVVFQGNTLNSQGEVITEIYLVEIDKQQLLADIEAVGEKGERPRVPQLVVARRLTRSENGLSDFRHWLRTSQDGKYIYALGKDDKGNNQLVRCEVDSGNLNYLSDFSFSINSPINLNPQSDALTFVAQGQVYVFYLLKDSLVRLTDFGNDDGEVVGVPSFSSDGKFIVFNQFVKANNNRWYIQIKKLTL